MPTFLFVCDVDGDMAGLTIAEKVQVLVTPIVKASRLELVAVEFKKEGRTQYLRIFIDKPGGVTIEDCQRISQECDLVLDVEDLIPIPYVLEVSSPGLDRPLKTQAEYQRFLNHLVKIKTFQVINGQKKFVGYLRAITEETATTPVVVTIRTLNDEDIHIPYNLIASTRLEVEF